jgi:hypothetical protein
MVAPTHNLSTFNRDNRYKPVFVDLTGADGVAVNLVFKDDDAGSLRSAPAPCNAIFFPYPA